MSELFHYGVLGMRWGIRRKQSRLSSTLLSKSKTSNMNSWGKDPQHNVLYVTGYSGSGKSTIARSLANSTTNVVHLDSFFEMTDKNTTANAKDKEFVQFLKKNFPEHVEISHPTKTKRFSEEWFTYVDKFMEQTERFGTQQFFKNKKVIIEGIQLHDTTTYLDKKFFKDKPLILTGTSGVTSFVRRIKRDQDLSSLSLESAKEYVQWYITSYKNLKTLSQISNAQKGSEWVKNYLSKLGEYKMR
jgi:uridine kinase